MTTHSDNIITQNKGEALLDELGLRADTLPRHVAVIMDGNGRWAQSKDKHRTYGHMHGAKVISPLLTFCSDLGIEQLTLYSFSSENWKRPNDETSFLMDLAREYLAMERDHMVKENIRFSQVGRSKGLPDFVLEELDLTTEATAKNTGTMLALALNYGSRMEITDAVKVIAEKTAKGELQPDQISETTISDHLYTAGQPDPDLLIRTAGEMRVSNYLLWQISYAELYVTETLWPEFNNDEFLIALKEFARRKRRFGGV